MVVVQNPLRGRQSNQLPLTSGCQSTQEANSSGADWKMLTVHWVEVGAGECTHDPGEIRTIQAGDKENHLIQAERSPEEGRAVS